jgi:hypothetical protein
MLMQKPLSYSKNRLHLPPQMRGSVARCVMRSPYQCYPLDRSHCNCCCTHCILLSAGGGCNLATRTCNPITTVADGTACTGGKCRSGVCYTCANAPGQAQADCICSKNPLGRYQDTYNGCTGGVWCYQTGGAQYTTCSSGLLYDASGGVCNWASQVTCPP